MKTSALAALILSAAGMLLAASWVAGQDSRPATTQSATIDWQKATALYQRSQRGEPLTPEEQAYLDKAKAEIHAGRGPGRVAATRPGQPGGPNGVVMPPPPTSQHASLGLLPLNQMTAKDNYKGEDGGLYGQGKNDPPPEHLRAARKEIARIVPLDKDGKPAADGKIVLMSVGMSNTMGEFGRFKALADASKEKSPLVVVANGAISGMTAIDWSSADRVVWPKVQQRLQEAQVTEKQVEVIWLKQAIGTPARFGDFPKHAQQLKEWLIDDIHQVLQHYPNVRVIYLSSRIYGGNATVALNPEPYAYESAFAMRWVILDQIKGVPELNYDPAKGQIKSPVLLWGPYLWADGTTPRKSDGLAYQPGDFQNDGTHPSPSGAEKVANLLVDFFKSDLNAAWYVHGGAPAK